VTAKLSNVHQTAGALGLGGLERGLRLGTSRRFAWWETRMARGQTARSAKPAIAEVLAQVLTELPQFVDTYIPDWSALIARALERCMEQPRRSWSEQALPHGLASMTLVARSGLLGVERR